MIATCAIILNDLGEILLIRRGREPYKDFWALISGIGETKKGLTPDAAVLGEVYCDLQTKILEPKRLFSIDVKDEIVDEIIVFTGKVDESRISMHPPYSLEYRWISPEEARRMKLAFEHAEVIEKYLAEKMK